MLHDSPAAALKVILANEQLRIMYIMLSNIEIRFYRPIVCYPIAC